MNSDRVSISGAELIKMARKSIDKKTFDSAMSSEIFQDFIKICILMSMATSATKEASSFGHVFVMRDPKNKSGQTTVEFQVQITSLKDQKE